MVIYLWNNSLPILPKGFSVRSIIPISSDLSDPSPVVVVAHHPSLPEKGTILVSTFATFVSEVVDTDDFHLLACEKPEEYDENDNLTQMTARYWAFFLLQIARMDTMVCFSCVFVD